MRDYVHIGVDLACNWFPHNSAARLRTVFVFDLAVFFLGLVLLYAGICRMPSFSQPWIWWRYLAVPMAGLLLAFDSFLFLTGILLHEDAWIFKRVPEYQQNLRRRELAERIVSDALR